MQFEREGNISVLNNQYSILLSDVEIIAEDIPGWQVTNMGNLTVALDVTITTALKQEGLSRELINRIQNLRKELNFEVTDRITVCLQQDNLITPAVMENKAYICAEILADDIKFEEDLFNGKQIVIEDVELQILIAKQ
jgi:isoleucyl-tRNA synthetase